MIELNRIYNENCLDTMKRMQDNFIDLTVTSPPYDNLRDYKGYKFPFKHIARHLYKVTKFGGVVVWVVGDATINGSETGTSFKQALFFMECGFRLHDTMIFEAKRPPLTHNRYEQAFEYIFVFSKGAPGCFNGILEKKEFPDKRMTKHIRRERNGSKDFGYSKQTDTRLKYNIWRYFIGGGKEDEISHQHPAIFPEQLAKDNIYTWSNENDLVYDPFTGSGTTLKMAHLLKRNWIGSEISKEYCEITEKRMKPYLQQLFLL